MRTAQRGVKLFAIALAIILIIIMAYLLMKAVSFFVNSNSNKQFNNTNINKKIDEIEINLKTASLSIDTCSKYRVDTDNEFVKIEIIDNKLRIKEKKHNPITRKDTDSINLCIKEGEELDSLRLDMGAGKLKVDELNAKIAEFDLGAGSISLDNLNITEKFELDGGAGSISIDNSIINNGQIDLGLGVLDLTGKLLGNTSIDGGVGSIKLNLLGNKDDYKFDIEKGIGRVTIDDTSYNTTIVGEGSNLIKLETGVGGATILFKNSEL